jgi:hypothetical protein
MIIDYRTTLARFYSADLRQGEIEAERTAFAHARMVSMFMAGHNKAKEI